MIPYNKNLNKIKVYEPGKTGRPDSKVKSVKLSSNESPLSFSSKTLKKIKETKINLEKYPDPDCTRLRLKIAQIYNISKNNIIFGNGSDEIFFLIAYCFLNPKTEGLYSKHAFLIYPIAINAAGGRCSVANEKNFKADVNALLNKCNKNTRVCFIANPNNPTGTYLNKRDIKRLREGLPKKCLLVIDSAYSEYVVEKDYSDSLSYAKKRNDIIVTRTFSKIFGISSQRLGWAYCPKDIATTLNKLRPAFNINSFAQLLGEYVLDDKEFLEKSIKHNLFWKEWLTVKFKEMGFEVIPSVANFILIRFKNQRASSLLADELAKSNIYVRKLENYGLPDCLRITIGLEKDLKKLITVTKRIFKENNYDLI